ncbi:hypothetical protein CO657_15030 [Rhizobium acidisoli]|uniref:Uncharacterized protein n=1 Tax=Rhizobium acidisoli TaxID=1538158 RepID=A0AAE5TWS7_9HYPH|nr:hypothetical protein [Rhizobium acidisoli]KPH08475.1 hypothetical protein AOG23_11535 [Rhizobium acidisoli]QAS79299.1 hypothetical protein CO657_15030 [Rhizobium acidisoli]
MKRVNLLDYYELAETLQSAKQSLQADSQKAGSVFFGTMSLPPKLTKFIESDNGFTTSIRAANELLAAVNEWSVAHLYIDGKYSAEKFDEEVHNWQYSAISKKIDAFRSVFEAECHDIDIYSVGQIAIYKTQALVAEGASIIPEEYRRDVPEAALSEFNSAGKCLAFDLPTSCGFHALRGLELVMDEYLKEFGVDTKKLKNWFAYITEAKKLIDDPAASPKPSPKVAAMLDRMRDLDRNPLMHPRDTLDTNGADQLFKLAAITVGELVRDIKRVKQDQAVALLASAAGAALPS